MEVLQSSISNFLIHSLALLLFIFTFINAKSANELVLQGKLGENPLIQFLPTEKKIKLICDLNEGDVTNSTLPQWSFRRHGEVVVQDVGLSCDKNHSSTPSNETSSDNGLLGSGCEVLFDESKLQLVLMLDDINENAFGDYVCHTGNMSLANKTFSLKELVHLSRKGENGKEQKSVIVIAGETLDIYCNETGLQPKKHQISWWLDDENITEELTKGIGLFENFSKTDDSNELSYRGTALLGHRGNYSCEVNLRSEDSEDIEIRQFFPVKFSFFVRVKEGDEWKLPLYVLIGECIVIGVFTMILNWREKRQADEDIIIEDSEDEDDVKPSSNNGTQNNNSNPK